MRRRFQHGRVFKRGKRRKVWVGRFYEPVLVEGRLKKKRRSIILGLCSEVTRGQAKQTLLERLREMNEGLHVPVQQMMFADYCAKWDKEILSNYRPSTQTFYRSTLNRWILPHFGPWQLGEIQPPDVQAFVNQFRGYSTSVLKHLRATLSCVFQTAMTWKYIQHNPASGLQLPQGKSVKRAVVLTPEQLRLVITNLQEPYKTMATVMAGTAIRESELLALKWSDLDYTHRLIHIRRSVYRGVLDEQTKTEESERDIPMCDTVVRVLLNLQKGPHNRGEYVFLTEREKIYRPEGVQRRHFNSSAETLGIPRFTWRSFRRTSATALHGKGVPLKVQREIMGHTNEETSLIYTEVQLKAKRRAIEQLEEFLFGSKSKLIGPKRTQVASEVATETRQVIDSKDRACSSVG